jgi:adhesin HecA-like repeat protein
MKPSLLWLARLCGYRCKTSTAPSIKIDGKIKSEHLNANLKLLTGTDVRYQLGESSLTGLSEASNLDDKFAIDVGALGGLQAKTILLQAHAKGTGVRIAGNILTQQDFKVVADKAFQQLQGSQISSGSVDISASDNIQIDGEMTAVDSLEKDSEGVIVNRTGDISLKSRNVTVGASGQLLSNADVIVKGYAPTELANLEVAGSIESGKSLKLSTENFKTDIGSSVTALQDLIVSGNVDMQGEHNVQGQYDFQGSNGDARLKLANAYNAKLKIDDSYKYLNLNNVNLLQDLILDNNLIKRFVAEDLNMLNYRLVVKAQDYIKLIGDIDLGSIDLESGDRIVFDGTQTSRKDDYTYRIQQARFKAKTISLISNANFVARDTKVILKRDVATLFSWSGVLDLLKGDKSTLESEGLLTFMGVTHLYDLKLKAEDVIFFKNNSFWGDLEIDSSDGIGNRGNLSVRGSKAHFNANGIISNSGTIEGANTDIQFKTYNTLYNEGKIRGDDVTLNADDIYNKNSRSDEASWGSYVWTMDSIFIQERHSKRWGDDVLLQEAQHRLVGRTGKSLSEIRSMTPATIIAKDDLTLNADYLDNDLGKIKAEYLYANVNRVRNTSYTNAYQISGYREGLKFNSWGGAVKKHYGRRYFSHEPQQEGAALSSVINARYIWGSSPSKINSSITSLGFRANAHKPASYESIQRRYEYGSTDKYPKVGPGNIIDTSATARVEDVVDQANRLDSRMNIRALTADSPSWSEIKPFSGT